MIKTNIKLRVTPEQSEDVQNICFANGVFWYAGNRSEVRYTEVEYLFIDSDRVWFRDITDHNIGTETEGYTEVDADLFIKTNGTCEEDKKEMDLRNTWCYATVPNHDRLRLLGYNHMPVGCCKSYYYIDCNNNISDLDSHPNFKPDYNEIKLNEKGEFEYATLSSQQDKSECQFAKYGFEKPDFECELWQVETSTSFEYVHGLVLNDYAHPMGNLEYHKWNKKTGEALVGCSSKSLTPIKKPWYETCKFPCLIKTNNRIPVVVYYYKNGYVHDYRDNKYCVEQWRLITNDEIEELKQ